MQWNFDDLYLIKGVTSIDTYITCKLVSHLRHDNCRQCHLLAWSPPLTVLLGLTLTLPSYSSSPLPGTLSLDSALDLSPTPMLFFVAWQFVNSSNAKITLLTMTRCMPLIYC